MTESEAEDIVNDARPPFPRRIGDGKWLVHGQTPAGRYLQVVYVVRSGSSDSELDYQETPWEDVLELIDDVARFYVIHARDLSRKQRLSYRRSRP